MDIKHKPWVEKDWTKWSDWDCVNVEEQSPWINYYPPGDSDSASAQVTARIVSALPVRQATYRRLQLYKHYEKMNSQKKQAFDQTNPPPDLAKPDDVPVKIIIEHAYGGPVPAESTPYEVEHDGALPARQAALRLSDGTLVMPIQTSATLVAGNPDNSNVTEYTFPRLVNEKPLFSATDKIFLIVYGERLQFNKKHMQLGPLSPADFHIYPYAVQTSFPITSLMYKGKLEY
jgi:hypothetical protein